MDTPSAPLERESVGDRQEELGSTNGTLVHGKMDRDIIKSCFDHDEPEEQEGEGEFSTRRRPRKGEIIVLILVLSYWYLLTHIEEMNHVLDKLGWDGDCPKFINGCSMEEDAPEYLSTIGAHNIPQYVLEYAPLVHLYSEEQFWPCDIAEHLHHITPELDYAPIDDGLPIMNLTNLDQLNVYEKGRHVFLTSNDNVEERPDWLGGQKNIPDDYDEDGWEAVRVQAHAHAARKFQDNSGGRSDAPAVLITVDKGHGIVDAFWFFFYSYNLGNVVFNIRWGNHVGDWEHTLVRFQHGKPKLIFYSEHNFGSAYTYSAVEKIGKRPIVYSAVGTHAMYATSGSHPYVLPLGILHDETDKGPLWDPALNSLTYTYDHHTDILNASSRTPHAPTEWFFFGGHWGDKSYPSDDNRQYGFAGQYHYVSGPLGPRFKNLGRKNVCQGGIEDPCVIKQWLLEDHELRIPPGTSQGEGEEWRNDGGVDPPDV